MMEEETIDNVGAVPREVSADAGYYSAKAVGELYALGVDPFVAPEQTRHGRVVPPAPRGRIPSHLSPRDRMRRKLQTRRGRQRYALRMQTVEPVFGQIKQGRGGRCLHEVVEPSQPAPHVGKLRLDGLQPLALLASHVVHLLVHDIDQIPNVALGQDVGANQADDQLLELPGVDPGRVA